ncbi:hypothetical protein CRE_28976 [Caenorhabditis remanei]|uniref:F-box domain-containing protein n=1 Tax=Caenorhabditis remanei TaxID=31234 RepID=E3N5A0_CAERE|nr:hypothetical protein CRE_28976 [Caenorhabditis remanei]
MTTPFPLLRLPRLALIPVFQQMESIDVIAISMLSKKANNVSKIFRKLSVCSVNMIVDNDHLDVSVRFEWCTETGLKYYFNTENAPNLVNGMFQEKMFNHENTGLSPSQWLERVFDVTNCESLEEVDLCGSPQLEMCDTLALLTKVCNLNITKECSDSFAKKSLEIVSPVTTEISLYRIPFETREEFQTFLKSNSNYLYIYSHFSTFTLNDFLVTNALKVELRQVEWSARDISQFLTNWFHSKHNSRLEHLSLRIFDVFNETCLPRVLKAVPFPRDPERTFFYSKPLNTLSESFRGGYDIRRTDGKKATILFGTFYEQMSFDFYLWPCFV